jgi:gliding motility-associated-like protein
MVAGDNGVYLEGGATNTNPVSVTWTPAASLTNATTFLTTAKPANTTTYTLTVTDANGCVATDNAVVTVLPYCLKVMDAFTPNGDGQNDRWIVTNNGGQCVQQVYVTVHNRYGSIVYKNDNYQNNWDGTYNGKPIADGTYYYVVKYTLVNGGVASVKGDVTILR